MLKDIPVVQEQLKKCVRCGLCRSVCPVFQEIKNETATPRGQVFLIQMLRDGEISPSPKVMERVNRCLLCETCFVNCPSGIPVPEFVAETRSILAPDHSSPVKNFVFRNIWSDPGKLKLVGKMIHLYQAIGLRSLVHKLHLTGILPGDLPKAEKMLAAVPKKSARSQLKTVNQPQGEKKIRVGYFLGCATDLFYPQVALATVKVLTKNGCEVLIPSSLKCCGMPQLANGQKKAAEKLAEDNIRCFAREQVDYIITDCASCGSMLKSHLYEKAPEFVEKVIDVTDFLINIIQLDTDFYPLTPVTVTYHDPCHLAKSQKISQEPRDILKMIPGVKFVEMNEPDRCCGGAGTFGLSNYDLSMKILDRKIAAIQDTGAHVAATCCPTCTMQLSHGLDRHHLLMTVKHPVELLAEAYGEKH